MRFTHAIQIEAIFIVIIVAGISGFFILQNRTTPNLPSIDQNQLTTPIIASKASVADVAPVIAQATASQIDTSSQPSPDGTKRLTMKITHNPSGSTLYTFLTSDGNGQNPQEIYSTTYSSTESASIPFNTWSPDDKYVFIQKNDGDALVVTATGEQITQNSQFLDVKELFNASGRTDQYTITTGWASPTLLIVNTTKPDGTKGSSYWFEVPTKAIIQLSSQF